MRQLFQDLKSGRITAEEIPVPNCAPGHVLVRNLHTAISPGTERMLIEFGKAGWLRKARSQPERVRLVLDKMRTDGVLPTIEAVFAKLGEPMPLGYCNAGIVCAHGDERTGLRLPIGTMVAGNGNHGEYSLVPANLCVSIPAGVDSGLAAMTPLGAIALQGLRLAAPMLGETFVVIGMGIVGHLSALALMANGCRVIVCDTRSERLEHARGWGLQALQVPADNIVDAAMAATDSEGADGVLICAATDSPGPLRDAARACRRKGRVVLLGVVGSEFDRTEFFRKELTFQVSASYGHGRYDEDYETGRRDLNRGEVRWTARRNFEAYLCLLKDEPFRTRLAGMVRRYPFEQHEHAYEESLQDPACLAALLEYPTVATPPARTIVYTGARKNSIGVIGCGSFARRQVLPVLAKLGAPIHTIVSARGASAARAAQKFAAARASSDENEVLLSGDISSVFVLTRHDSHADLAARALKVGKAVYLEKPAAINIEELARLYAAAAQGPLLRIGYNRRQAPMVLRIRETIRQSIVHGNILVNAGPIAPGHWTMNPAIGGGRIVGEVCHFVDLASFLAGSRLSSVDAQSPKNEGSAAETATVQVLLSYDNGSTMTITYWSGGPKSFPKERVTVAAGASLAVLDNFRALEIHGGRVPERTKTLKQDKGHHAAIRAFLEDARRGGKSSIQDVFEAALATFAIEAAIATGARQQLPEWWTRLEELSR